MAVNETRGKAPLRLDLAQAPGELFEGGTAAGLRDGNGLARRVAQSGNEVTGDGAEGHLIVFEAADREQKG